MKCNICKSETKLLFKGQILNKYNVQYYQCPNCDFIQTEKPYWLKEAYENAITDLDVGLVSRNLSYSEEIEKIIKANFNYKGKFLDFAGGYGLFVRLMRDIGLDFYRQDKYCENIFATNFDLEDMGTKTKFEVVTAFEVFEHLEKPLTDIEKMLEYSDTIIFSAQLQPKKDIKNTNDWWYFVPETGQHISFYAGKTLEYIAREYNLFFYSSGDLHLLTKKKFTSNPLLLKQKKREGRGKETKSLEQSDFELAKKVIEKAIKNKAVFKKELTGEDSPMEKLVNHLSLIESQLERKIKELDATRNNLNETRISLNNTKSKLSLTNKELEETKSKLSITSSELAGVYASKSWRVARLIQKVSQVFFPVGSIRRKIAGILFRVFKKAARAPRKLKNKITDMFFRCEIIYFRLKLKKKRNINAKSKKIVYIGHSYHLKTKSTEFLIEYLKKFYDVELIADESWKGESDQFPDLSHVDNSYLAVILFQNMPEGEALKKLLKNIKSENLFFCPMYDATSPWDYTRWRQLRKFNIINFSSTLNQKLQRWGFESMAVQYFPKPLDFTPGEKNTAFFWQRLTFLNINVITKLFGKENFKIHIHKAIDPAQEFIQPTKEEEKRFNITYSDWFETREEMLDTIKQKAIYVAPREYEGLGQSFLEAMAMGKAVIAVNNPTMNEYIEDGKTGFLFDLSKPKVIDLSNVEKVQKNTYKYICDGYKKWEKDKHKIIDFIEGK